jgi:hypothetical protein
MKEEFLPYERALKLKEFGFDEPCFARFSKDGDLLIAHTEKYIIDNGVDRSEFFTLAPLFQQAFRWFREKYDIHYSIDRECSQQDYKWGYNWSLYNYTGIFNEYLTSHPDAPAGEWVYDTYEDAELALLDKLIEIVELKQSVQEYEKQGLEKYSYELETETRSMKTAVEWFYDEIKHIVPNDFLDAYETARVKEQQQQIEFACQVYDKYNFGTQEISFREECELFKQQEQ